ncbi:galactose ABC transporter substrate-binding protein [Brachyspira sp.]|uniref:galactose ABC transporter substrate-binding protein n=1 Tax=Brachyspira sp. TaxID=1977261 RepID=UPI0026094598|nr:galactose ABC transporter substrate-binding protein [Brachyspira sp.]
MKNKKDFLIVILILLLISCSNSSNYKNNFIGITVYRTDDLFANSIKNNISKFISGKAKYIIKDSKNNQTIQNEQIDDYISKGVKVLVINLVDPEAAENVISKAKAYNIPLILFNKAPDFNVMSSYNKVWYVGTTSKEVSDLQGEIILNNWTNNASLDKNNDGKIQCVIIKGEPGHIDAEIRSENVITFLNNNGVETDVLNIQTAMWNRKKASEIMSSWMKNYESQIEYIICNNDSMALGALSAIQNLGYNKGDSNKYIPIVGIDGTHESIKEIKNGAIVGTVLNDEILQARAISDLAINLFNGHYNPISGTPWRLDNRKAVKIPYKAITIDNLENIEQ